MRWVVWALCLFSACAHAAPKEKPTRPGVIGAQPPAGIAAPSGPIAQAGGGKVTLPLEAAIDDASMDQSEKAGPYLVRLDSEGATLMRFANSRGELMQAKWVPFQSASTFQPNGQFPAQIWVQTGRPSGLGMAQTTSALSTSEPMRLSSRNLRHSQPWLTLISIVGPTEQPYTWEKQTLTFEVQGLDRVKNVELRSFTCDSLRRSTPARFQRAADGRLTLTVAGAFERSSSTCGPRLGLSGSGGNFDNAETIYMQAARAPVGIRRPPMVRVERTADFAFLREFNQTGVPHVGCSLTRNAKGQIEFSTTSGALPTQCVWMAYEQLQPLPIRIRALNWREESQPATFVKGDSPCRVAKPWNGSPQTPLMTIAGVTFDDDWYVVAGNQHPYEYVYKTNVESPLLPGNITPNDLIDLQAPLWRQWVLPIRAGMSCRAHAPFNEQGTPLPPVTQKLILESIDVWAPPGFNLYR